MIGLKVLSVGPSVSVQDQGRPGFLDFGVSQGGAVDIRAVAEGAALLRQDPALAVLEMGGFGGCFEVSGDLGIALTGAPMKASLDGVPMLWNASHQLRHGQRLEIGAVRKGAYGYLHIGGGIDTAPMLGARSVHLAAGLGRNLAEGDLLPAGHWRGGEIGLCLPEDSRFNGGDVRILESFQSPLFARETRTRLQNTPFKRGARANRMGVELSFDGPGFAAEGQLDILSEVIVPGDVQMTGDGRPFVLMRECQTTGGYPRIGTVLPCDLPKIAQGGFGSSYHFKWVSLEDGLAAEAQFSRELSALPSKCEPIVRDPAEMADLLSQQLIGGVVSAFADPFSSRE